MDHEIIEGYDAVDRGLPRLLSPNRDREGISAARKGVYREWLLREHLSVEDFVILIDGSDPDLLPYAWNALITSEPGKEFCMCGQTRTAAARQAAMSSGFDYEGLLRQRLQANYHRLYNALLKVFPKGGTPSALMRHVMRNLDAYRDTSEGALRLPRHLIEAAREALPETVTEGFAQSQAAEPTANGPRQRKKAFQREFQRRVELHGSKKTRRQIIEDMLQQSHPAVFKANGKTYSYDVLNKWAKRVDLLPRGGRPPRREPSAPV